MRSFLSWQYAFTNGMEPDEQHISYEKFCIPESKRLVRGALSKGAYVDFKKQHNPLLILAGTVDHCIPPSLNKRNFNKYKQNGSVTTFMNIEGRNHFVLGQSTWKEDADYILQWINKYSRELGYWNNVELLPGEIYMSR